MRAVVYTKNNYFELGIIAKNSFLGLLKPDDDGKFDSVQAMSSTLREKVKALTDDDFGMSWSKESYIEKFKKSFLRIQDNERFLITSDFSGNQKTFKIVELLNLGHSLKDAIGIVAKAKREK